MNGTRRLITTISFAAITWFAFITAAPAVAQDCNTNGIADSVDIVTGADYIYWMEQSPGAIYRMALPGGTPEQLVTGLTLPHTLAIDLPNGRMYWTDRTLGALLVANLDGSNVSTLVTGQSNIGGIALHNGKIYFARASSSGIRVCNLDGSNVQILNSGIPANSIVIRGESIYYAGGDSDNIGRLSLDGSVHDIIQVRPQNPAYIDVDLINGDIYWVDNFFNQVRRSTILGNQYTVITPNAQLRSGFSIDPVEGYMYLSYQSGFIERRKLDGSDPQTIVTSQGGMVRGFVILRGLRDCDGNGMPDECDIANGTQADTNGDGILDMCNDCNTNGIVDSTEPEISDCNGNQRLDVCDIAMSIVDDCNGNGVPDECELAYSDCNANGVVDACDSTDMDADGLPDECELWSDCNNNGVNDAVEVQNDYVELYWTEPLRGTIWRATYPGGMPEVVVSGESLPRWITIDEMRGRIYWTSGALIRTATLDGSDVRTVQSFGSVVGLTTSGDRLFLGTGTGLRKCTLEGFDEVTIAPSSSTARVSAQISARDGNVYTSDSVDRYIKRTGFDGGTQFFGQVSGKPSDIDAAPLQDYMFWINNADAGFTIRRRNISNNTMIDIVATPEERTGIIADTQRRNLYIGSITGRHIEQRDYDGNHVKILFRNVGLIGGLAIRTFDADCNNNGIVDSCDTALLDCNTNGLPDDCDAMTETDCDLNGIPDICEAPVNDADSDGANDSCDNCTDFFNPDQSDWHSSVIQSGGAGLHTSLAFDSQGRATLAYYVEGAADLRLWFDANGDGVASAGEIHAIDTNNDVGRYPSVTYDTNGIVAIAYFNATASTVRLWHDDNGDFEATVSERHVLNATSYMTPLSLTYDGLGKASLAYVTSSNSSVSIWYDANGDHNWSSVEEHPVDGQANATSFVSHTYDSNGVLHVAYYYRNSAELRLWRDLNGNLVVDSGERKTIDTVNDAGQYPSLAFDDMGNVCIAYYEAVFSRLRFFHDANGNGSADTGELSDIDYVGDVGKYASLAFDTDGTAVVAYYDADNGNLKLWRDLDQSFTSDDSEISTIASADDVGSHASLAFAPNDGTPHVAFHNATTGSAMISLPLDWDDDGLCYFADPCPSDNAAATGDLDLDGDIDGNDFALFLNAFGHIAGEFGYRCGADFDSDGAITFLDYQAWLQAYRDAQPSPIIDPPQPTNVGDLSGDGVVDGDDISIFVSTVLNPSQAGFRERVLSDLVWDGTLDQSDIVAMVHLLVGTE